MSGEKLGIVYGTERECQISMAFGQPRKNMVSILSHATHARTEVAGIISDDTSEEKIILSRQMFLCSEPNKIGDPGIRVNISKYNSNSNQ